MFKNLSNFDITIPNSGPHQKVGSKQQQNPTNTLLDKFGNMQKLFDKGDTTLMNFTESQQKQII